MSKMYLRWKKAIVIFLIAITLVSTRGDALASRQPTPVDIVAIEVWYKLDPRLSGGVHLGERWVSPPLYDIVSDHSRYTIEARVESVDANGDRNVIQAIWVSANPNLVMVKPKQDDIVLLHFRGQGNTSLEVSTEGFTKSLTTAATYPNDQCSNLRVKVSQDSQPDIALMTCRILFPFAIK